ncbi:alkaline phosphatase PafA [Robiginitalea marina]|uniref:Alkaline phosphatase family protein n=1 Tax=Robiginitalea marina TaxID=2954105 RepID=A0ABT1B028_9FLAO|nr:alkaline phosphatase PafA [Robiginitalea marina]MCO5725190.1 alkaline phosphatase family protein [Robiginitalea marina]
MNSFKPFRKLLLPLAFIVAGIPVVYGQGNQRERTALGNSPGFQDPPRLVVGLVVDQMRFDYLSRFWNHYGEGGFRRLVGEGFLCRDHHFNYAPTSTGPGHASVYTGTTPSVHGIIGNDWYDRETGKEVYCAGDPDRQAVGTTSEAGKMSPHRMLVTTITDQLRLHHQLRSKVVAVALKDRGATLPGGHLANAAYWFEGGEAGRWISSSFYMENLPGWVEAFNASGAAARYKTVWEPLKEINTYAESGPDNVPYEGLFKGEAAPVFPHDLPALWEGNGHFDLLRPTPFGNSLTLDFALRAVEEEGLGADIITDFLAISFSSTDYVGHKFGVNSREVQDTYLRLDQDLERLLIFLDRNVGKGQYTVFLTSDHGAGHVPAYLKDLKVPAGYLEMGEIRKKFNEFLRYTYGDAEIVRNISNNQVFLDQKVIRNLDLDPREVEEVLAGELLGYPGIQQVYTGTQMRSADYTEGIAAILQNGYHQKRSGDLLLVTDPATTNYTPTGSTHGSPWIYDTHVPLIFYGKGIRQGELLRRTHIRDIAPTLAVLLGTAFPSGATGLPIAEALD